MIPTTYTQERDGRLALFAELERIRKRAAAEAQLAADADAPLPQAVVQCMFLTLEAMAESAMKASVAPPKHSPTHAVSLEEARTMASAATFDGARRLILIAHHTGCRPSELLLAKWGDVDFDAARLLLRRPFGGTRMLDLSDEAMGLLREWREDGSKAIFKDRSGWGALAPNVASRALRAAARAAGLPPTLADLCRASRDAQAGDVQ
jgi:integrase